MYQGCCWTQRNVMIWKPKLMRIWVSTENNRGPEIRPDGGRRATRSFHAGLRLTDEENGQKIREKEIHEHEIWACCETYCLVTVTPLLLTGKDNDEDDSDVNEEELEVSKVTEYLRNKDSRQHRSGVHCTVQWTAPQVVLIMQAAIRTE